MSFQASIWYITFTFMKDRKAKIVLCPQQMDYTNDQTWRNSLKPMFKSRKPWQEWSLEVIPDITWGFVFVCVPDSSVSPGYNSSCIHTLFLVANTWKLFFAWEIWAVASSQRGDSGNTDAQLRNTTKSTYNTDSSILHNFQMECE